jgi:GT2 family glycosyltransferase
MLTSHPDHPVDSTFADKPRMMQVIGITNTSKENLSEDPGNPARHPTVWVCLAVYNRIGYTQQCLELLRRQTYRNVTPVVVDDGSNDGTSAMIAKGYPETVLLRGDGSLYWTGAMHVGIAHILNHSHNDDYALLLNDDLVFGDNLIQELLRAMTVHPRSLIQAVESCADDPDLIWQGGVRINFWTAKHHRLNYHRRISEFPRGHFEPSDYLTGRGVLAPVEVFRVAGNYDARYKQGGDPEFARRAARKGYHLLVAYDIPVLSYEKGRNLNEAESYALSDITLYYFSILSNTRLATRWKTASDMTDSAVQSLVFFSFDLARITWHFIKRVRLRSPMTQ